MKNADVFFSKKNEKGEWERPEPVEGELNTEFDEGIVAFSPDAQTMYLTKARRELNAPTSVEIYTSTRSDAKWSAPVKFEITADTLSTFGHPAVSPDGEYLYFVSDMPGGYGGKDIWRISLKERQGSLVNLGPDINTEATTISLMCVPTALYISRPTDIRGWAVSTFSVPRLSATLPTCDGKWRIWASQSTPPAMISESLSGRAKMDFSAPTAATRVATTTSTVSNTTP